MDDSTSKTLIDRRKMLQRISVAFGGAISAPLVSSVLAGTVGATIKEGEAGKALNAKQAAFVGQLADIIIPPTKTAGGKDAGVVGFIDKYLIQYETDAYRKRFLRKLDGFMSDLDKNFLKQPLTVQTMIISEVDSEAFKGRKIFYRDLKRLIVVGYFTSEIGATEELDYQPVPGPYIGEIKATKETKNYAI